jgi:large subunit ribosomal protein L14
MIQPYTKLQVFDNSGAKTVKCINTYNTNSLGSVVLVSIRQLRRKNKIKLKIKKGSVVFAQVLKTTIPLKRNNGLRLKSAFNGVVLLNKQLQPLGSRIFGIVPKEIRNSKIIKLITISGLTV